MALIDPDKATEEFQRKAEEGYFDEIDEPLMTNEQWERIQRDLRTLEHQRKAETGYFDETDKSFKTYEWEERLHRALFTREEWEKVLKAMDEIYNVEREARKKAYIRKKVLEDRNIEFIMPKETMNVDPIPDESIHTIDFAHGYDYYKNVMIKEIHKLFKDDMNGIAGEFIKGWNLALEKVLEVIYEKRGIR